MVLVWSQVWFGNLVVKLRSLTTILEDLGDAGGDT